MQVKNIEKTMHKSVMLEEALLGLQLKPAGVYVDATYGRGGHTKAILAQLNSQAKLLLMDKDPHAINDANLLAQYDPRVTVFAGSFKHLRSFCQEQNLIGKVDGILFDLGVSSPQLDQAERGFSFMRDGALDMRMDPTSGISAAQWLATATVTEISRVLKEFGEERFSNRIANAIVQIRTTQPLTTTKQLADLITKTIPFREKNKHPATRSFQALRIFINNELEDLELVLDQVLEVLAPFGRLVVISFHSLEDRIVKQFIAAAAKGDDFPHLLPIKHNELQPQLRKIGKALQPSEIETTANARARSAVLRVAEKLPGAANA